MQGISYRLLTLLMSVLKNAPVTQFFLGQLWTQTHDVKPVVPKLVDCDLFLASPENELVRPETKCFE